MSQQQRANDVSVDAIPVDVANSQSAEVDPVEVPEEIQSITRGLASEQPPTNPLVILKRLAGGTSTGRAGLDPAFRWAIEWARHLATDTPSDVEQFDAFLEYLVAVGFADEKATLR